MDYHSLPRRQLQTLCKKHGIPANAPNAEMADALSSLLMPKPQPQAEKGKHPGKRITRAREPEESEEKAAADISPQNSKAHTKTQRATRGRETSCTITQAPRTGASRKEKSSENGVVESNNVQKQEIKVESTRNAANKEKTCNNGDVESNAAENPNLKMDSPKSEGRKGRAGGVVLRRGRVKVRSPGSHSRSPNSKEKVSEAAEETEGKGSGEEKLGQPCLVDAKETQPRKKRGAVTFSDTVEVKLREADQPAEEIPPFISEKKTRSRNKESAEEKMVDIRQVGRRSRSSKHQNSEAAPVVEKAVRTRNGIRKACGQERPGGLVGQKRRGNPVPENSKAEEKHDIDVCKKLGDIETCGEDTYKQTVQASLHSSTRQGFKKGSLHVPEPVAKANAEEILAESFIEASQVESAAPLQNTRRSRRMTLVASDKKLIQDKERASEQLEVRSEKQHKDNPMEPKEVGDIFPAGISRRSRRMNLAASEVKNMLSITEIVPEQIDKRKSDVLKDYQSQGNTTEIGSGKQDKGMNRPQSQQAHRKTRAGKNILGTFELEFSQEGHENGKPQVATNTTGTMPRGTRNTTKSSISHDDVSEVLPKPTLQRRTRRTKGYLEPLKRQEVIDEKCKATARTGATVKACIIPTLKDAKESGLEDIINLCLDGDNNDSESLQSPSELRSVDAVMQRQTSPKVESPFSYKEGIETMSECTTEAENLRIRAMHSPTCESKTPQTSLVNKRFNEPMTSAGKHIDLNMENPTLDGNTSECVQINEFSGRKECQVVKQEGYFINALREEDRSSSDVAETMLGRSPAALVHSVKDNLLNESYYLDGLKEEDSLVTYKDEVMTPSSPAANMGLTYEQHNDVERSICEDEAHHSERHLVACSSEFSMNFSQVLSEDKIVNQSSDINAVSFSEEREGFGQEVHLDLCDEEKPAGQKDMGYHDGRKENQQVDANVEIDCGHELTVNENRVVDKNSGTSDQLGQSQSSIHAVQVENYKLPPGNCSIEMFKSKPYSKEICFMSEDQRDEHGEIFEAYSQDLASDRSESSSLEEEENFGTTEEFSSDREEYDSERQWDFSASEVDNFSGSEEELSDNEDELPTGEVYYLPSGNDYSESEEELSDSEEEFSEIEQYDSAREEDILKNNEREHSTINDKDEKPFTTGQAGSVDEIPIDEVSNVDVKHVGSTAVLANYETAPVLMISSEDFETFNPTIGLVDTGVVDLAAYVSDESLPVDEISCVQNKDFAGSINFLDMEYVTNGCLLEVKTKDIDGRMTEQHDELPEIPRNIEEMNFEMFEEEPNCNVPSSYGLNETIDGAQSMVDFTVLGKIRSSSESVTAVKVKEDDDSLIGTSSNDHSDMGKFEGSQLLESDLNSAVKRGKDQSLVAATLSCESDSESLGPGEFILGVAEVVDQSLIDKNKSSLVQLKDGEVETSEILDDLEVEQKVTGEVLEVDESCFSDIADTEPLESSHGNVETVIECPVVEEQALVSMITIKLDIKDAVEVHQKVPSEWIEDPHEPEHSDTETFEDPEAMDRHRDANDAGEKELEEACASDAQQDTACCTLSDLTNAVEDKGDNCLDAASVISPDTEILKMSKTEKQVDLGSLEVNQKDTCGVVENDDTINQSIKLFEECPVGAYVKENSSVASMLDLQSGMGYIEPQNLPERENASLSSEAETEQVDLEGIATSELVHVAESENLAGSNKAAAEQVVQKALIEESHKDLLQRLVQEDKDCSIEVLLLKQDEVALSGEAETEQVNLEGIAFSELVHVAESENLAGSNEAAAEQLVQKALIEESHKDLLQSLVQEDKDCSIEVLPLKQDEDVMAFTPEYLEIDTAVFVVSSNPAKEAEHYIDTGFASALGNEVPEFLPEIPSDVLVEENSLSLPECEQKMMPNEAFDDLKTNVIENGSEVMQFENEAMSFVPEVAPGVTIKDNEDIECDASESNKDMKSVHGSAKEGLIEVGTSCHECFQDPIESFGENKVMNVERMGAYLEELHKEAPEEIQPCGEHFGKLKQNVGKEPATALDTTAEISKEQSLQQLDLNLLSPRKLTQMCKKNEMSVKKQPDNGTPAARKPSNIWMSARKQSEQANTSIHPRELPSASKRSALKALPSNIRQTSSAAVQTPTAKVMPGPRNLMSAYDGNEGTEQRLVTPSPQAPLSSRRDFARSHHR